MSCKYVKSLQRSHPLVEEMEGSNTIVGNRHRMAFKQRQGENRYIREGRRTE